jgi:hypothetical protein
MPTSFQPWALIAAFSLSAIPFAPFSAQANPSVVEAIFGYTENVTGPTISFQQEFVAGGTSVSTLLTSRGDLFLFRVIGGKYIPGFKGTHYIDGEGGYSYSLNPYISLMWRGNKPEGNYVLVASQRLETDQLFYPDRDAYAFKERGDFNAFYSFLKPGTPVDDIQWLSEVKVPIEKENVIFTIPQKDFQRAAAAFEKTPFPLMKLIKKAAKSPNARLPNES